MFPIICRVGPFTVYSYGLMLAAAVIVCFLLLSRDAKKSGMNVETISDFVFWMVISGLVGARVFFILLNLDFFIHNPGEMMMIHNGGLAWQGGLLAGGVVALGYMKKKKLPFLATADVVAPYLALGQAIGRIGCFLNGCCYGRAVEWGIYFPVHDVRLHPTQLYATAQLLLVFFILKGFQKVSKSSGRVLALYLMLASLQRFINEFFRADHTEIFLGLSLFQFVSMGIFAAGLLLFVRIKLGSALRPRN